MKVKDFSYSEAYEQVVNHSTETIKGADKAMEQVREIGKAITKTLTKEKENK